MKDADRGALAAGALWLLFVVHGYAQCPNGASTCVAHVPRLRVNYFRSFEELQRQSSPAGVVGMTFSVYSDSTGGAPLWQEKYRTCNYQTRGTLAPSCWGPAPAAAFRWTYFLPGNRVTWACKRALSGETERPRVLMVSVPYALKAGDAETLGGLPASRRFFAPLRPPRQCELKCSRHIASFWWLHGVAGATGAPTPKDTAVTAPGGTVEYTPEICRQLSIIDSQVTDSNNSCQFAEPGEYSVRRPFYPRRARRHRGLPGERMHDLRGSIPTSSLNLGPSIRELKAITIYLGPYTYNINQITLRKGLKIIGVEPRAAKRHKHRAAFASPLQRNRFAIRQWQQPR